MKNNLLEAALRGLFYGLLTGILLAAAINLAASIAQGAELHNLSFESTKIYNYRNPYLPEYTLLREAPRAKSPLDEYLPWEQKEAWNRQVALTLELVLVHNDHGTLYWDQKIAAFSTTKQFRHVYWDFEIGVNVLGNFEVFHHHKSEHSMEQAASPNGYPLLDMYGVRFCFAGTKCGRN
jgi:hypothetical protein